ncbi:MAG: epoxyqueuosine reductase QueH [Lachnospiraceae bacterium]|nr:epoxyqueuosine reductase QueH [Lachnospiraceae bacterium]
MKRNYQKELDQLLLKVEKPKKLFLHSCCAPCSSYVLEYLSQYFEITVFYYNPNISPESEYQNRVEEQKRLIREMKTGYTVRFIEGKYQPEQFYHMAEGMEELPEGGKRCYACYEMRMRETAKMAEEEGADYFTTTLSISPYKNASWINEIGEKLEQEYGIKHLPSDFKKKNGYRRSIELSKEYGLYRQDYCGCIFSKMEREQQK